MFILLQGIEGNHPAKVFKYELKCICCGKTDDLITEPPKGLAKLAIRLASLIEKVLESLKWRDSRRLETDYINTFCEECMQNNAEIFFSDSDLSDCDDEVKACEISFRERFPHDIDYYKKQALSWSKLCCRNMLRERLKARLLLFDNEEGRRNFYEEIGIGEIMNVPYYAGAKAAALRQALASLIRLHRQNRCSDAEWQISLDGFLDTATVLLHENGLWNKDGIASLKSIEAELEAQKKKFIHVNIPVPTPMDCGEICVSGWYDFKHSSRKMVQGGEAHNKQKALLARFPQLR